MTGDLFVGVAPAHRPAALAVLAAVVLLVPAVAMVDGYARLGVPWACRLRAGVAAADTAERWAAALLLAAGIVHLALPLGHHGGGVLTAGFLTSGAVYCWLAHRVTTGRRWRGPVTVLVPATLVAYLVVVARGEEVDQVGLATALIEVTTLGLALSRRRRVLAGAALVVVTTVFGIASWLLALAGHDDHRVAGEAHPGHHHHDGGRLARAQAGVIMRPGEDGTTEAQRRAAAELAAAVRAATGKYRDLAAAVADGYRLDGGERDGFDLHYAHKGRRSDAAVLDPARPEMLVYARQGGRAALLGVVFQMPRAGERGPQVGGATTTWHAHNVCVGLLPPGFGPVTPYGGCPFLTVQVTVAEMMHVWVVDSPAGPFADRLPAEYAKQVLARDGRPA